ncbi:MAG TPA: glycosyltransferase family 2 protein [Terriglobia bacterium]|nr:glycosyltransferase family 2 protein [Terriglobia bacterium]
MRHSFALIIPALDEVESIGILVRRLPRELFAQIIVVDNGSRDATASVAAAAGADVVREPRRGYGQACLAGIQHLRPQITAVAFMDGDLTDDPDDLARMVQCFEQDEWDMVLGSRVLGRLEGGSLTPMQRFGNWLSTRLIALAWNVDFTDLGPLRIIRRDSLARLNLRDRTFGWNVEMQARAAQTGLRICEVPVNYHRRLHGRSKISGTITGSLRAGFKILWTIFRCGLVPLPASSAGHRPQPRMDPFI